MNYRIRKHHTGYYLAEVKRWFMWARINSEGTTFTDGRTGPCRDLEEAQRRVAAHKALLEGKKVKASPFETVWSDEQPLPVWAEIGTAVNEAMCRHGFRKCTKCSGLMRR